MKTVVRLGCAALSLLFADSAGAQIIWDFTAGTGAPLSLPDHLTGGVLSGGNMAGTLVFNATSACTLADSSKGNNAGLRTLETATFSVDTSTYFEFTVTPDPGYELAVTDFSFNTRRSSSGPTDVRFYTSLDNYSFVKGTTSLSIETWTSVSFDHLSLRSAAGAPITFRIYSGPSGTASSPNWRVDDLALSVSTSAVPEPASTVTLLGGAALAITLVIRFGRRLHALTSSVNHRQITSSRRAA